jgi:L-malate glycosyltransferase
MTPMKDAVRVVSSGTTRARARRRATDPTRAPRVALVIGQLGLGGAEKQLVLLAKGLHQRGLDVCVLVMIGNGVREAGLREAGVPVIQLGMQPLPDWRAYPELIVTLARMASQLRRFRPTVVHGFLFHSYVMGAIAARMARVPVVVAGRSRDDFKRGHRIQLFIEKIATRLTDLLVANAHAVATCVHDGERVPRNKVTVVYNGIPPDGFVPAQPAEVDTVLPVLLCVANLRSYKGHVHLFDALALLRDRGLPCTLLLAGDGPDRAALHARAAELRIDVRFLGQRTDVDRLLARADLAVLPSLTEGMSNAVMEAMAAGRPVVATAVGGIPELLADGRGALVPPADPAALANAIADVFGNRSAAEQMAQRAKDWTRLNLHADVMVQKHIAIYNELLEQRCAE